LPIKEYTTATNPGVVADGNIAQGSTWVNDINNDGTVQFQRRQSYRKWWFGNLARQKRSIHEKLNLFLIDLFGNEAEEVGIANLIYRQHLLIRQHALGNYKQLVQNITTDLAMLRYLNGDRNIGSAPDENYARELMELFTLGKGPASKYTENDVKEAAKVLSGWRINATNYTAYFTPNRHNSTNKTFSSFFNNKVIRGLNTAAAGTTEIGELMDMIFAQSEVANYIVRRLYRWFVYYEIDASTEQNVIVPLANIFRDSNYEMKPLLKALFSSEHFFDPLNRGCIIKSPAEFVVGSLREMQVSFPDESDWATNYGFYSTFFTWMSNMGQTPHDPPNVSGMPAYYQEPLFHEIWINSDSLPKRSQYTDVMVATGYSRNGKKVIFDVMAFAKQLRNPGNPNDLIDESIELLFRMPLSAYSKLVIKTQILLSGQQWDYYWTNAWMAYIATPNAANFNTVNVRLQALYKYLCNLSEYQLC